MRQPVPNAVEVDEFKLLCSDKFGLKLADDEAQHYGTKIIQLYYVLHYGVSPALSGGSGCSCGLSKLAHVIVGCKMCCVVETQIHFC